MFLNACDLQVFSTKGIGICLRDDPGDFVLAKTDCFSPFCDVDVGEVVGLHTAMEW